MVPKSRVGWEGSGKAENEAWKGIWVLHGSQRVGWEGFGKVQNGSEECGGLMVPKSGVAVGDSAGRRKRSLRHLTRPLLMKHEKGGGCFSWFPRVGWEESEASKRGSRFPRVLWEGLGKVLGVSHGSQEWGASKGVRVFLMVPKSGVGKAWEGKKWSMKKQAKREHTLSSLSSMLGEVPFCKNKLKENMLCQVCLVKCRFTKKQGEREHASSSRTDRMPVCKREHVCQVGLVKCFFAKASWKRTCFVKYAWWNAVLQDKLKENVLCQVCSMPVEMPFCETSSKRTCLEPQKGLSWLRKCQGQNADQGGVEPHRHPIATWYMTLKWKVIFTTYLTLFLHICDALPPGTP